jgi:hypothetical protein
MLERQIQKNRFLSHTVMNLAAEVYRVLMFLTPKVLGKIIYVSTYTLTASVV